MGCLLEGALTKVALLPSGALTGLEFRGHLLGLHRLRLRLRLPLLGLLVVHLVLAGIFNLLAGAAADDVCVAAMRSP
jgi:hypothetical protein